MDENDMTWQLYILSFLKHKISCSRIPGWLWFHLPLGCLDSVSSVWTDLQTDAQTLVSQHGSTGPTERRRELAQKYAAALWTQRKGEALRDLETLGWGDGWLAWGLISPVLVKIPACEEVGMLLEQRGERQKSGLFVWLWLEDCSWRFMVKKAILNNDLSRLWRAQCTNKRTTAFTSFDATDVALKHESIKENHGFSTKLKKQGTWRLSFKHAPMWPSICSWSQETIVPRGLPGILPMIWPLSIWAKLHSTLAAVNRCWR